MRRVLYILLQEHPFPGEFSILQLGSDLHYVDVYSLADVRHRICPPVMHVDVPQEQPRPA